MILLPMGRLRCVGKLDARLGHKAAVPNYR
jgi:hypothetical protein